MASHNLAEVEVKCFHVGLTDDLAELLASDASASHCWCMWFIDSVQDFHAAGSAGNRAKFEGLARSASERQVDSESVFASAGFVAVHRPTANRVVMQRAVGRATREAS